LGHNTWANRQHVFKVYEKACCFPEPGFPPIRPGIMGEFYGWLIGDIEAPDWVTEALEQAMVGQTPTAESLVVVRVIRGKASALWWKNARVLFCPAELPEGVGELLVSGGGAEAVMSVEGYEQLIEWATSVPGEREGEHPFDRLEVKL
jgi:hypothetical protein